MIDAARWITEYGYVAVVIGSIIEGETIAFLAGAAAHKHLLFYLFLPPYLQTGIVS